MTITHTAAHPAPAGIDLDSLPRPDLRHHDEYRRGYAAALSDVQALARKAALDAPAADERALFEAWATGEGLIQESHGIRSVSSMIKLAEKAWNAALAQCIATSAADAKDAARYRWMRDMSSEVCAPFIAQYPEDAKFDNNIHPNPLLGEETDRAIDAAMAASRNGGDK